MTVSSTSALPFKFFFMDLELAKKSLGKRVIVSESHPTLGGGDRGRVHTLSSVSNFGIVNLKNLEYVYVHVKQIELLVERGELNTADFDS